MNIFLSTQPDLFIPLEFPPTPQPASSLYFLPCMVGLAWLTLLRLAFPENLTCTKYLLALFNCIPSAAIIPIEQEKLRHTQAKQFAPHHIDVTRQVSNYGSQILDLKLLMIEALPWKELRWQIGSLPSKEV